MKKIIVFLCFCLCFLSGCGVDADMILQNGSFLTETASDKDELILSDDDGDSDVTDKSDGTKTICVYVCGAVNVPGVYELSQDSRIYQAVELAGGLSAEADEKSINLAETLTDEQMIRIPTVEEAQDNQTDTGTAAAESGDSRINLNTATAEELTGLTGIGETKANAIITYREAHGGFQSADEIMQVDGIGESTFQKIQDDIFVE